MKGDFSFLGFDPASNYTGVRHQQGRVLLDRDWNDAQEIEAHWRERVAGDAFGRGALAVPTASASAFRVIEALADAAGVHLTLQAGRAWAAGLGVSLDAAATLDATYLAPPLASAVDPGSIAPGVRDAVLLEVWEDAISGFQDPAHLIEPALGGVDTTARVKACFTLRLLRLDPNQDCPAVAALVDDPAARGHLSVTPSPALVITGDCPLEAGGGYTGLEHYLYRFEVAEPANGQARFKWSQFNGGLVGRGRFTPDTLDPQKGTLLVTDNDQPINTCGLASFYLEALRFDAGLGRWVVDFTADASLSMPGVLVLADTDGVWPAPADGTAFFRLWNGVSSIAHFATGAPVDFVDGLQLQFDAPLADNRNYRPGDYWCVPVRASGAAFDPPLWPLDAPPQGPAYRRVALAEITWKAAGTGHVASWKEGDIHDCRSLFRPLSQQKICCSFVVGDGRSSFGDFDSIELALAHLPAAGGEICLLPGLHATNAVIRNRTGVTLRGCGARTRVLPRERTPDQPIVSVIDSSRIEILHIDFVTLGGTALWIEGSEPGRCSDIVVAQHRILACTHAVFARNAAELRIAHNRIRMFDRAEGRAAIDVAGTDLLVEANSVALVPAERTPPVDPDDPQDPIDPVDPCVRLGLVYKRPLIFSAYVAKVWTLQFPLALLLALLKPWLAQGGIQVRGGSERVRVRDNEITGGAGHGITLGAVPLPVQPPAPPPVPTFEIERGDAVIVGQVLDLEGRPLVGAQVTFRQRDTGAARTEDAEAPDARFRFGLGRGVYEVSATMAGHELAQMREKRPQEGLIELTLLMRARQARPAPETGFLYDIAIERNRVSAMGLCGIGVPLLPAVDAEEPLQRARRLLGTPVVGLRILDNRLLNNLRNPFDVALRAAALTRGLGGISLGLVDDAQICGNRIEGHGRSGADPVCGVFVQYGEALEVARNIVLDNGAAPRTPNDPVREGERGGVVLGLAAAFGLFAQLRKGEETGAAASAARVLDNHVEQPVGNALRVRAFGPVLVHGNVLASDIAAVGGIEAMAGVVMLANLAGVQNAGQIGALAALQLPLPAPLLFNDNQVRAGPAHAAPLVQLLFSQDDLGVAGNQCHGAQSGNLLANTLALAPSVRVLGNRWRETAAETSLSLLSVGTSANNTSFNQGDHCIVAVDASAAGPALVDFGNQVLIPNDRCAEFGKLAQAIFNPNRS
ncbi:DUF6519 domain-containing protein [Azohydromonas caseinilytica]|uniref:Right handed beta helix region n=1 Tax=Azohydromonas caseinilytica TaxID=2728836 RepID=A0A848FDF2_9BURK|nr:DUF6519 domain-containing protein [Azohydromonas caseinilytica]NML16835.1 hypothetical protein [Azohydromonas caseinilytica]